MKRTTSSVTLVSLLALSAVGGCAEEQKKVERGLSAPGEINCATAAGDIRVLKSEKAHVAQRIVEGATAIYPASAVVGILMGTESTKLKVGTGEYNKSIDDRIAQIKQQCGEVGAESH